MKILHKLQTLLITHYSEKKLISATANILSSNISVLRHAVDADPAINMCFEYIYTVNTIWHILR